MKNVCTHSVGPHVHTQEGIVPLHGPEDFAVMRRAGKLASQVLDFIAHHVKPGKTTEVLNTLCHEFIVAAGAVPAPLGYRGFPKSICTSLNNVVCHGIPGNVYLQSGDILNIDVTVILDGWHGDTNRTFFVGTSTPRVEKLVNVTYEAMMAGIDCVKPGATLGDIGHAIQIRAHKNGFSVVEDFCGHGIGRVFHGAPSVLHFGKPGTGLVLEPGMFFTIEPMINMGKAGTRVLADGWTAVTRDNSLSAQFEHTVAVTETGVEIFTVS